MSSLFPIVVRGLPPTRGFVTLLAVLIIAAIGGALTAGYLIDAGRDSRIAGILEATSQASSYADACAETALWRVHSSDGYEGSDSLSFAYGACTYRVSITGSASSTINATGIASGSARHLLISIATEAVAGQAGTTTRISTISWREVGP